MLGEDGKNYFLRAGICRKCRILGKDDTRPDGPYSYSLTVEAALLMEKRMLRFGWRPCDVPGRDPLITWIERGDEVQSEFPEYEDTVMRRCEQEVTGGAGAALAVMDRQMDEYRSGKAAEQRRNDAVVAWEPRGRSRDKNGEGAAGAAAAQPRQPAPRVGRNQHNAAAEAALGDEGQGSVGSVDDSSDEEEEESVAGDARREQDARQRRLENERVGRKRQGELEDERDRRRGRAAAYSKMREAALREVTEFLDAQGLQQYYAALVEHGGYDDMRTLAKVEKDELDAIGMKSGHQKRLFAEIKKWRKPA